MSTNDFSRDDAAVRISDDPDRSELTAHVERLLEENGRLREENERLRRGRAGTHRPRHRRLALGMALLGVIAALGALRFPATRDVLFATAATGAFGGLLTYSLSRGPFLAAAACDRMYAAVESNGNVITDELDLADDRIYVPDGDDGAYLFLPRRSDHGFPERLDGPSITNDRRGVVLESTGTGLLREAERTASGDLPSAPSELAERLADVLAEQFEFARRIETSVDEDGEPTRVTVTVTDGVLGSIDRFDHPIASFFAVGLAVGLENPVRLEGVERRRRNEWRMRYRCQSSKGGA
jgi:hypothetical protein